MKKCPVPPKNLESTCHELNLQVSKKFKERG